MIRLFAASAILLFIGLILVLSEFRIFRSRTLANRVSPYLPGGTTRKSQELLSLETFGELLRPLAEAIGAFTARTFGVSEELPRRLRRVHWEIDASGFRVRQVGWALGALAFAVTISLLFALPAPVALIAVLGAPLLAFLMVEQQLANASDLWKQKTFQELPVVSEQVAMLLGSGYSLGAALQRVSERGTGVVAQDLRRVVGRIRQGSSEQAALQEWADIVDVPAVERLVSIFALNKESGDLGSLVATEARNVRAEAHRFLIEEIEKKTQQVWIPVTVAALVPGVILMMIPFIRALSSFG